MEPFKELGFKYRMGSFIKKFSKIDRKRPIKAPRLVVKAKDVNKFLGIVHDEAGHVGVGNTRRNCIKDDSLKIW